MNTYLSSEKEKEILKFWEEIKLLDKIKDKNKAGQPWSFLDGPITANNPMGVHHAWGRTLKDLFPRYKAMQGYDQRFQNGFDCQGLHVEVEVEKDLGFKTKKDIEAYGIEQFVNKCKERVHKYSKIQTEQSIRLGMMKDWGLWQSEFDEKGEWIEKSGSYYTMSDENNYAIWHFLKKCREQGLLYKGRDVVPWCPRCGTAISQHEILTEEYKEITHKAIFVKFKFRVVGGQPSYTYFLVWTTTPWTLPGNTALAVHPDFDYVKVKKENEFFILLKDKVNLIEGGEILEIIKGKELEGLEYEGIFDELCKAPSALHKVILWKDITQDEGTGIVHIAPGCGQEDYQLSKDLNLPAIDLIDNESNYREGFSELSGKFVGKEEIRKWIFENLENKGLVYKIEDYKHRYPTCWRCKSELIFRLVDEWYVSMDKLREPLKQAVEKINWTPGFCKEREIDWLNNMHDWLISKKRYWGLALPIWECQCGNFEVIGSKEELKEKAFDGFDNFDGHSPHRPWLDDVKIKCSKCGRTISRIPDVGNPWLDAGIVPFSTLSYFKNQQEWQKWFPADLVCESFPGQFKNWFYVLLVMSQVLEKTPPFKTLLGYSTVVDEKGEEMHKSKGNAIWFDEGVEKIGADVMRWMYITQNPSSNLRFGYNAAKETQRKILTLVNCFTFFNTYRSDNVILGPSHCHSERSEESLTLRSFGSTLRMTFPDKSNVLDKWILSRINGLIKTTTEALDSFDAMKASQAIEDFWINDLSLWYVRRSRKRFAQAQETLYYILLTICKLIAPMMPFLAEQMYQDLKSGKDPVSVHLCDWPAFATAFANATAVKKATAGKPKYSEKYIDEKLEQKMNMVRDIVSLALAKRMELKIGVRQALNKLKVQSAKFKVGGEFLGLIKDEVNVKEIIFDENIDGEVELDTTITEELKEEGIVREIIRQIQDLRKKAGLTPKDIVDLHFSADTQLAEIINKNQEQITETAKLKTIKQNLSKQGGFLIQKEVKIDEVVVWFAISHLSS